MSITTLEPFPSLNKSILATLQYSHVDENLQQNETEVVLQFNFTFHYFILLRQSEKETNKPRELYENRKKKKISVTQLLIRRSVTFKRTNSAKHLRPGGRA
jgi:hypothetical protein